MRRIRIPILVVIALVIIIVGAWANNHLQAKTDGPIVIADPPQEWLEEDIKVTDLTPSPRGPDAAPAADQCGSATPLNLSFANPADGSGTLTNLFTQEASDPVFECMFGGPTSLQGYRTAWYQLTAGDTSIITITTEGTEYDTVLGVYAGSCEALTSLACSDDFNSFQSKVSIRVIRGQTYYIEVADYKPGAPEAIELKLSAVMQEGGANWSHIGTMPYGGVSRHAFASDGPDMYIIGGQTRIQGPAPVISRKLIRYSAIHNRFDELADVPGSSLSNTTAVHLGGKIYVPGGFNGDTSNYVNVHLVFDIATNFWEQIAPIPTGLLPNGQMFAWSSAVAAPDGGSYFVTGGLTSYPALDADAVVIPNMYRYTPSTNQWTTAQSMSTPRYAHTAAWVTSANRGLCVAGGLSTGENGEGEPATVLLTGGECFNPATGTWQPTGQMNFPRYSAGSAVGPDGNWYVFGGLDANGGVPETEVYNPNTNSWQVLGGEFSLGGPPHNPPRVWPRGAFWGDALYVFGGNTPPNENRVISSADRMTIGVGNVPLVQTYLLPVTTTVGSDNLLANGAPLILNSPVAGNFVESTQFFNAYYFDWPEFGRAILRLTGVPNHTNFSISVYDVHKVLLAYEESQPTGDKTVSVTVRPSRYYVVIQRVFPKDLPNPNDVYHLTLLRE